MEGPEIHQPHARHGGGLPRWLELLIALTALITSVSSIAIALHHGEIMEKLVEANSIPYLQGGFSDITPDGADVLSLDLLNRGVGPAHEKSLRLKIGDKYVRSIDDVFISALGPQDAAAAMPMLHRQLVANRVRQRFIPSGETQLIFRIRRTPENAAVWDRLAAAQENWAVEFCYCSVFDECWDVKKEWDEPRHVEQCVRDEATEFKP